MNKTDKVVGVFQSPKVILDGIERDTKFIVNKNVISVVIPKKQTRSSEKCWRATFGKWTYRVMAGMTCGAFAAGTGGIGGFACGLAAAGAEDCLNFNKVCR